MLRNLRRWWYRLIPTTWLMEIRADLWDDKFEAQDKPCCRRVAAELSAIEEALTDTRLELKRRGVVR